MVSVKSLVCLLAGLSATAQANTLLSNITQASHASQACGEIAKQFPNNVAYNPLDLTHLNPSTLNFTYTVTHYWNGAHGQLVPSCVFYPTNTSDVSFAVKVLNKYPDVPWAAKSGGHNPNKNWSSVDQGVLFSFRPFMQGTKLNADNTADIGPGARWDEAVSALEPYNRAVVGGRLGDVGVGGYTLGGGLSFLSAQYGLACDLVEEYDVVLADGTVAKVNNSTNTDLWYALKGGGNQFAIITNFHMRTVPIGQVWGGVKIYGADKAEALLNATHDFAANYPDVKAAIIPTFEVLLDSLTDLFFVFFFYNGETVPAGVFDKFDAIEPISDGTKVQSYASLLTANDAENIYGFNYLIRAQTIPLIEGDDGRSLLQYQAKSFHSYAVQTQPFNLDLMIYSFAIQPVPISLQNASLAAGKMYGSQNTFDFDITDGSKIWMEYDISWINPLDESNAFKYANHFTSDIVQYARKNYPNARNVQQTNNADTYTPLFLNDGMFDQATSLFYKPDAYAKLKKIQQARDPKGFFSKRSGGNVFS